MSARLLGEVVAHGSRSWVHAYGQGAVVKIPKPATPESWILAEAEYAEAARTVGAPAPELLGIERISRRQASVWKRVDGPSMWQQVIDRPDRSAQIGRMLADVQQALFELVPPATLPRQRDRLTSKIRWSAANVDPSIALALDLMPADPSTPRLCHGDLHPSNVILCDGGPMIVDWFDASLGARAADVARSSLTLLGDGATGPSHLPGSDRGTLGVLTEAYLGRLRERLDLTPELLTRWRAINAAARLAEGVARRPLLEVWRGFAWERSPGAEARAAAG
jgi:aminoglycoside phosphotransferase (APT) family kinase protein